MKRSSRGVPPLIIDSGLGFDPLLVRVFDLPHIRHKIGFLNKKVGSPPPGDDKVDVAGPGIKDTSKSRFIDKPGA